MKLVGKDETVKTEIDGIKMVAKVMPFLENYEWETEVRKLNDTKEIIDMICEKLMSVEGYESPEIFLKKIQFAEDFYKIVGAIASASLLNPDAIKNSESLSDSITTSPTRIADGSAEKEKDTVFDKDIN